MPQVDLETLVSVCGTSNNDRKIASVDEPDQLPPSSDDPPQSFWLSQDAELDWFDRNAVLERKDSTKGNSNSNSTPSHFANSHSQRLPVKKSILALPKPKRSVLSDVKHRRNLTGITLFPRRSASNGGKEAAAPMAEPSSPKVSCMGRVRSKRDKNRNLQNQRAASESAISKPALTVKKNGFWKTLLAVFRSSRHEKQPTDAPAPAPAAAPVQKNEPAIEPAGLLGTKRFVSGRKSDSWIGDLDLEQPRPVKDAVKSGPSDCDPVWRRRNSGPLNELNCSRSGQLVRVPSRSSGQ
uniref:Uncharacterized protein n=1 Tax=Kalanchoe fedtschenkoi TaxID=63787 RepID=A0A7N0THY5_KALFE